MRLLETLGKQEFYRLRDARTSSVIGDVDLDRLCITLGIDAEAATSYEGQLAFLTLANLNARWCRQIQFVAPDIEVLPALSSMGTGALGSCCVAIASRIDPFGSYGLAPLNTPSIVEVGRGGAGFSVYGSGWIAAAGESATRLALSPGSGNPLGPMFAACLGTAHAMQTSLGRGRIVGDTTLSLWTLDRRDHQDGPTLVPTALGKVLLPGLGAVGSGIAALFPLMPFEFEKLVLLDHDRVDYSNLNRVPLFFAEDVGEHKVSVVERFLIANGVNCESRISLFDDSKEFASDYDLVIPAANEHGFRWKLQEQVPPVMAYGSTGPVWDAYMGRHVPFRDDCLACRFPAPKARTECSLGSLTDEPVIDGALPETGALPFLSLASSIMAVAELAKLGYEGSLHEINYATISFDCEAPRFMGQRMTRRLDCGKCPECLGGVWHDVHKNGRHTPLST